MSVHKSDRYYEGKGYEDGMEHKYEPPHNSIFQGYRKEEVQHVKDYNEGYNDAKKDRKD